MAAHLFRYDAHFPLESGGTLPGFELAYQTYGKLNARRDNVIWVCHALTANAAVDEWWPGMIGPGAVLDTDRYFVICANMLGSCYGSTHALSQNPLTGSPYFHDFPLLTNRDIVRAFEQLRSALAIEQIFVCLGGSMGGQQVLEWGIMEPERFVHLVPIATNAQHSPWGIAFNESQRMAIAADASWYDNNPQAGLNGMRAARAIALLSYRNYDTYQGSQTETEGDKWDDFRASSYQQYQGEKLVRRFNAFSYWTLSKGMDSQHVGRGRGGLAAALARIQARTLVIGVTSDLLFPITEQRLLQQLIPDSQLAEIESPYGHDGFLIEVEQLTQHIRLFLAH